jgi:hypothetical protein
MSRFPQAIALQLAYASAAIATSPYSLPAAQLLGCPRSPLVKVLDVLIGQTNAAGGHEAADS